MNRNFILQTKNIVDSNVAPNDDSYPSDDDIKGLISSQIKSSSKRLENITTGKPFRLYLKEKEKVLTIRIRLNFIQYGYMIIFNMKTDETIFDLFSCIKKDIFNFLVIPDYQLHKTPPNPLQIGTIHKNSTINEVLGRSDVTLMIVFDDSKSLNPKESFIRMGLL